MASGLRINVGRSIFFSSIGIFSILLILGGFIFSKFYASIPLMEGTKTINSLTSPVTITADRYGIPTIQARSRLDALRALGYITARDRLFQMDLIRRQSAGRLSEIMGKSTLMIDRKQRIMGLNRVASAILTRLPKDQLSALKAYAQGVNAFINQVDTFPFEFLILGYEPDPWTPKDSVLGALSMFQKLSSRESDERMMSIMEASIPQEVIMFLTPDEDDYAQVLLGGPDTYRPVSPIPVEELISIRRIPDQKGVASLQADLSVDLLAGSNSWVISGSKTADGRAILANDMHMELSIPNIWYRVVLKYGEREVGGIVLPSIPVVIIGSNGQVAWGITNSHGDFLDLVKLELNPENGAEYRTSAGWREFDVIRETIKVRQEDDVIEEVKHTIWGPVSKKLLLGNPVAVHWTALDDQAVDFGLMHLERATNIDEAVRFVNRFKGPPLNFMLADYTGRIGWTYSGRIPIRKGFDGTSCKSWASGDLGWKGYIPPEELPRVLDPPNGFLATANNRTLGKGYPYLIGHNFAYSYRVYHISRRLEEMDHVTENDLFRLQLDTKSGFYEFYRDLAISILVQPSIDDSSSLMEQVYKHIENWDGKADLDSVGFGILVEFHNILSKAVFKPFLEACRVKDKTFSYNWQNRETPLRRLLKQKIPELLPYPDRYDSWDAFLLAKLEESVKMLLERHAVEDLDKLTWGYINKAQIAHPLAQFIPFSTKLLNMPQDPMPGCYHSIRLATTRLGASERMVISPGRHEAGIFHMPGGQSGHPLSLHYRDQHRHWVQGIPLPFLPGPIHYILKLQPGFSPK